MAGENGRTTPPAEGAPPVAVENKDDANQSAAADAQKEAPAAETKVAAEPEAEPAPAPAPAAAEATEESSDKAAEGKQGHDSASCMPPRVQASTMPLPLPLLTLDLAPSSASAEKPAEQAEEKPDVEMKDEAAPAEPEPQAADAAETAEAEQAEQQSVADADAEADKSKGKRKSIGGSSAKAKKLNKKASKPRMLHLDAKPGDHYFVKLKGFPQWPVIICDEDMLPASLLKSRPVTAKRADGTYREDYADGGKNVADRTFPVMYLHTNEL
jgi:hypothetical protein